MVFRRRHPHPLPHSFGKERYQGFLGFKPPLRVDFQYRCAYCQFHEWHRIFGGPRHFHVDHFRPRDLLTKTEAEDYGNLCYACDFCNIAKGDEWPNAALQAAGVTLVDPCGERTADLIEALSDYDPTCGSLCGRTAAAQYTIEVLNLNRAEFKTLRQRLDWARNEAAALRRRIDEMERTEFDAAGNAAIIEGLRGHEAILRQEYLDPREPSAPEDEPAEMGL